MDMITWQCFLTLAETKTFIKAAEKIGRTQSAVSQQIKKLESTLDKTLYKRVKGFALTNEVVHCIFKP